MLAGHNSVCTRRLHCNGNSKPGDSSSLEIINELSEGYMLDESEVIARGIQSFKGAMSRFKAYLKQSKEHGWETVPEWMPSTFEIDGFDFAIMTYMHLYAEHQHTGVIISDPEKLDMTREAHFEAMQVARWLYIQLDAISTSLMFCSGDEPHIPVIGETSAHRRRFYDDALATKQLAIYPYILDSVKIDLDAAIRGYHKAYEDALRKEVETFQLDTESSPRRGYVYLVQSSTGFYKIGRTKDPMDRIKTFNVKLPFEVDYACLLKTTDMYALEKELHNQYADKRVGGEWFNLSADDVVAIKELAVQS